MTTIVRTLKSANVQFCKFNDEGALFQARMFTRRCNIQRFIGMILAFISLIVAIAAQASPTYTTAIYYDKKGKLLQIEDLRDVVDFSGRILQEISEFPIPRIKINDHLVRPCVEGDSANPENWEKQPLSSKANFAIYYGYEADENAPRTPLKLEYVDKVNRKIKCEEFNSDNQCTGGKHCMNTCAGAPLNCASYCCVY